MSEEAASGMDRLSQGPEQCRRYQKAIIPLKTRKGSSGEDLHATGLLVESGSRPVIIAPHHGGTDPELWKAKPESKPCSLLSTAPKHSVILNAPRSLLLERDIEPVSEDECADPPPMGTEVFVLGISGPVGEGFTQIRRGIVSTTKDDFFCADTFVVQGTSGGAVWKAESGKLCGTVERYYMTILFYGGEEFETTQNLTGAAPVADWTQVIW